MQLLPNEEILLTLHSDKCILTNKRIQSIEEDWGRYHLTIMFLENISTVEIKKTNNPILLGLALLGFVAGIISLDSLNSTMSQAGFFVGIILLLPIHPNCQSLPQFTR